MTHHTFESVAPPFGHHARVPLRFEEPSLTIKIAREKVRTAD